MMKELITGGTGINFSVNEVYRLVEELLETGLKPIYRPDLPGEAQISVADISAAGELRWAPKVEIRKGLQRTIQYIGERVVKPTPSSNHD